MSAAPAVFAPLFIVLAGIASAFHIGKLPPAIGVLQQQLGVSLVEAGFLLSAVQFAAMACAIAMGAWSDSIGLRRGILFGLTLLALASFAGAFAQGATTLLALRTVEGFGFLLVGSSAPALMREIVPAERVNKMLGVWASHMATATALALLVGPIWIEAFGWRAWWLAAGALSAAAAVGVALGIPARARLPHAAASDAGARDDGLRARVWRTITRPAPWLPALAFCTYAFQWLAVIGFLPVIFEQAGIAAGTRGVLTALAAAANVLGNVAAGRLLHAGWRAQTLLRIGLGAMTAMAIVAFAGADGGGAPAMVRYGAVLLFSAIGGLVPTTLFSLAVQAAPDTRTVSTGVGWMLQWSGAGQFAGPPAVAWVASLAGGWHWTWAVTGAMACIGLLLTTVMAKVLPHRRAGPP
ncbi:CynX/NimT family MFS transporter [Ramlibacter sp.]|uniref:MFS transporter n=1 Tax=Ramlibacter sp. TaxID=1917967 RepID=UPI003D0F0B18